MSAPSAATLALSDVHVRAAARPLVGERRERRSSHPIDRLSRELDEVCTTAVDALEIAAILEARGITDAVSRERYGCASVFELAEELFHRTPTLTVEPEAATGVPQPGSLRDLSHGVVFALNGIFFSVVLQITSSRRSIAALVLALVVSWSCGQAVSLLWYRVVARVGERAGHTVLRHALVVGLAVGLCAGYLALRLAVPPVVTVLSVAQVLLVLAAAVLLLYRHELLFLVSLAPVTGVALVYALRWPVEATSDTVLYAVVATIVVIFTEAAWIVRPPRGRPAPVRVDRRDVSAAGQIALYGALGALLLSYRAVSSLFGADHDTPGFDVSLLPLVLTIGFAEWQLRTYRRLTRDVPAGTHDLADFAATTWRFLLHCFARYWCVLLATTFLFLALSWAAQGSVAPETTVLSLAYAVLGGAFFVNLLLIAWARTDIALWSFVAAGSVYVVAIATPLDPMTRAVMYLVVCVALLGSLLAIARVVVGQALVHL
jgi:hypothetical protein